MCLVSGKKTFPKYCNAPRERLDSPFLYYLGTKSCKSIILEERRRAVRRSSLCPCHCKSIKHDRSFLQKQERLNKTSVFWKRPNKRVKNIFLTRTSSRYFLKMSDMYLDAGCFCFTHEVYANHFLFSPPSQVCVSGSRLTSPCLLEGSTMPFHGASKITHQQCNCRTITAKGEPCVKKRPKNYASIIGKETEIWKNLWGGGEGSWNL